MDEFAEAINNTYNQLIVKAKSDGFYDAQKYFNRRENKVLLNIAGEIMNIIDKEIELVALKKKLEGIITYINQYRDYQELR